jgi:hypothetical protein
MMHRGQIIRDFHGAEKRRLLPDDLLTRLKRSAARNSWMRTQRKGWRLTTFRTPQLMEVD